MRWKTKQVRTQQINKCDCKEFKSNYVLGLAEPENYALEKLGVNTKMIIRARAHRPQRLLRKSSLEPISICVTGQYCYVITTNGHFCHPNSLCIQNNSAG